MSITPLLTATTPDRPAAGYVNSPALPDNAAIERVEAALLSQPQLDLPLTHLFAPDIYWREIFMPAGSVVIGHEHKTEHFNVVLTGRARVSIEGEWHDIVAPQVFVSKPGVRKVLHILEDVRWATIHATQETDPAKMEELFIVKSETFLKHQHESRREIPAVS